MYKRQDLLPARWTQWRDELRVIVAGLIVVWYFPSVRQMLLSYKPTWEDVAQVKTPGALPQGRLMTWLTWRPVPAHAFVLAALFIWCVDSMTEVSEFLYFRF